MKKWKFIYDAEKNEKLKNERGISFEDVILAFENGRLLKIKPHHNKEKYPKQRIMVLEINGYAYYVPYMRDENDAIVLKTAYPSRRAMAIYLRDKSRRDGNEK